MSGPNLLFLPGRDGAELHAPPALPADLAESVGDLAEGGGADGPESVVNFAGPHASRGKDGEKVGPGTHAREQGWTGLSNSTTSLDLVDTYLGPAEEMVRWWDLVPMSDLAKGAAANGVKGSGNVVRPTSRMRLSEGPIWSVVATTGRHELVAPFAQWLTYG